MTDTELAYAAADMLRTLRTDLQAELQAEADPKKREFIEGMLGAIPMAMFLLGAAAGKNSLAKAKGLN
jgi:hypothetical protein